MISKSELDYFIEHVLKPYYQSFSNSDLELGARQINGPVLFVTDKYVNALNENLTVQEVLNNSSTSRKYDICTPEIFNFCRKLEELMLKSPKSYEFMIRDIRKDGNISCGINTPIFTPDSQCFGFQFIYRPYVKNIIPEELLTRQIAMFNTKTITLNNIYPIELDESEEKILSLLLLGYTQAEIATTFNCSRSSIAKIISEHLCPKFSIVGHSSRLLIEKAIELGYANFIPKNIISK